MAAKFSASRAPSSTAGLFKSAPSYTQPTANPARGSLQSGVPGVNTGSQFGIGNKPAQAAYGPTIQSTSGPVRALEGGGYVNQAGEKISGFSTPGRSSGGGGGGGGIMMPQQQAAPMDFYRGPIPELKSLDIPYEEFTKRFGEVNNPEQLAALAERYNAPTQKAFQAYLPQFSSSLAALGGLAQDYLGGKIPLSTSQNIARSTAAANLGTGLGRGGLGRNLTARDFGLQSINLQQQGADLFSRSVGLAQQGMQMSSPVSTASLMVGPQSIYDTMTSQAQANQQLSNQNLLNAWQSKALPGQFDITRGQYVGYQPGSYSATRPLTPEAQAAKDLQNRLSDLNSRSNNRYSLRGESIVDKYSGRTV